MINQTRYAANNGRNLGDVVAEIKDEIKEFLQTRVQMFYSEMREKFKTSASAAAYGIVALVFLATGYLLLTLALVGLVAVAFWGSPYAWFLSFLIVGILWSMVGAILAFAAKRSFKGFSPENTIRVLKEDKVWLQREAGNRV